MIDFKLYMRSAAYPRVRKEYRWERWLRIAYWFVMFPRARRTERKFLEDTKTYEQITAESRQKFKDWEGNR